MDLYWKGKAYTKCKLVLHDRPYACTSAPIVPEGSDAATKGFCERVAKPAFAARTNSNSAFADEKLDCAISGYFPIAY